MKTFLLYTPNTPKLTITELMLRGALILPRYGPSHKREILVILPETHEDHIAIQKCTSKQKDYKRF